MKLIITFSLIFLAGFNGESDPMKKWSNFNDFPKDWVMLERDSLGYLVYYPCDGSTPQIKINKDTLTIQWQNEEQKTLIEKFTRVTDDKFFIKCWGTIAGEDLLELPTINFEVRVVDRKRKLVHWKWVRDFKPPVYIRDSTSWIMTPIDFIDDFRKVDNPCETMKKPEKEFLPIEYH